MKKKEGRLVNGKRGQAAIEYLVTYGWTILIIIVTFGLILYFDVLSPSKFLPQQCEFGEQIKCVDMYLDQNSFMIKFLNNFPKEIKITDVQSDEYTIQPCDLDVIIKPSEIGQLNCSIANPNYYPGEKKQIRLKIQFSRNSPTAPKHEIKGVFVTTVEG